MAILIFGLILFLGVHSIAIAAPAWRNATAARLGEKQWKAAYAAVALAGVVLIVVGYGAARQQPIALYAPPPALRHLTALLMLPFFTLFIAAYLPGRIGSATKHPMLAAIKLWAVAHLLANGSAADVLLFGAFLIWAVVERISLKHRPQRPLPMAPAGRYNDAIAVVLGLLLYALLMWRGHLWLIGVAPLP